MTNLERVAAIVKSTNADIVLLQEVDRNTQRSGNVDQVAELARLTGMRAGFGKSLDDQGGEYGIAILSRWLIVAHETIPLHVEPPQVRAGGSSEPRSAGRDRAEPAREVAHRQHASRRVTRRCLPNAGGAAGACRCARCNRRRRFQRGA